MLEPQLSWLTSCMRHQDRAAPSVEGRGGWGVQTAWLEAALEDVGHGAGPRHAWGGAAGMNVLRCVAQERECLLLCAPPLTRAASGTIHKGLEGPSKWGTRSQASKELSQEGPG